MANKVDKTLEKSILSVPKELWYRKPLEEVEEMGLVWENRYFPVIECFHGEPEYGRTGFYVLGIWDKETEEPAIPLTGDWIQQLGQDHEGDKWIFGFDGEYVRLLSRSPEYRTEISMTVLTGRSS